MTDHPETVDLLSVTDVVPAEARPLRRLADCVASSNSERRPVLTEPRGRCRSSRARAISMPH